MKPVIVITLYRRYRELAWNLPRIWELAEELGEQPEVVLVWASPEVTRLWFVKQLLKKGLVQHVVTRPKLEGECDDKATSYPESHNIRLGLDFVKKQYPDNSFAIVQAADIRPTAAGYKQIYEHIKDEGKAFVCFWQNDCVRQNIWHTNYFATILDERYWPPVVSISHCDTLEAAYGKSLASQKLPGVLESHNARNRFFSHEHITEKHPRWAELPETEALTASLLINGKQSRAVRYWIKVKAVYSFIRRIFSRRK